MLIGNIVTTVTSGLGAFTELFQGNWEEAERLTQVAVDSIMEIISSVLGLDAIVAFFTPVMERIIQFFTDLWNEVVHGSIVPDMVNEIAEWFGKLPGLVTDALSGLTAAIVGPFKQAWKDVEAGWKVFKANVVAAINALVAAIAEPIGRAVAKAAELSPLTRRSPSLVDNVRSGLDAITQAYNETNLAINAPGLNLGPAMAGAPGAGGRGPITIKLEVPLGDTILRAQQTISEAEAEGGFYEGRLLVRL